MAPFGIPIVLYLFLAGLAAGCALSGSFRVTSRDLKSQAGGARSLLLSWILIVVGLVFLILDLERPGDFWMILTNANPSSAIAWGARIVVAFMLIDFYAWTMVRKGEAPSLGSRAILNLLRLLALGLAIYPGFVLLQSTAFPLWSSALVIPLIAVTGLHAGIVLAALVAGAKPIAKLLEIGLLGGELLLLLLLLLNRGQLSWPALSGAAGIILLAGFVCVGVLIPLLLVIRNGPPSLRALCIIFGCLALRAWLIIGGQTIHNIV